MGRSMGKASAIILGILVVVGIVAFWILADSEVTQSPLDGPGMVIFQTKSFSAQPIIGTTFVIIGFAGLIIGIISIGPIIIFDLFSRKGKEFEDPALVMVFAITFVFWAGVGGFLVYTNPLKEEIKIDNRAEEITVERTYIVRQWSPLRISFDAIEHITYYYHPSTPFGSGGLGSVGSDARGSVEITNRDGVEVEVSIGGPDAQYELAKGIARHTGKPLRRYDLDPVFGP